MTLCNDTLVSGILFLSFSQACSNLNFLVDADVRTFLGEVEADEWYFLSDLLNVTDAVTANFSNPVPIIEQIGIEMMNIWYTVGPGKDIIRKGVDFLRLQTGSEGYHSLFRGPEDQVGTFSLDKLDEAAGFAELHSTTPMSRDMERGVLLGGMRLAGDLAYVDVDNSRDSNRFLIRFIATSDGSPWQDTIEKLAVQAGTTIEELPGPEQVRQLVWYCRDMELRLRQQRLFWQVTNDSLTEALERLNQARRRLAEVLEGEKQGRLSGAILADRYEVGPLLGRGGMGEVYLGHRIGEAEDKAGEVAVKILHPFYSQDRSMLKRFEREAEVAARVARGYVPETFEVGATEEGQHYIVMERLNGRDLESYLEQHNRLPRGEVAQLIAKLGEALDAVHRAGAIHRDLKPSNIFLVRDDDGELSPRLLDFGVSKLQDGAASLTQSMALVGTPGFMAPEAARGLAKSIGPPADIFALGALAYLALSGRRPFNSRDLVTFLFEVINREPEPVTSLVPELPADIDSVMAIALAKDPDKRYQHASEFARDFEMAQRGTLSADTKHRARALRG